MTATAPGTDRRSSRSSWSSGLRRLATALVLLEVLALCEGLVAVVALPAAAAELEGLGAYGWAWSAATLARLAGILVLGLSAGSHPTSRLTGGALVLVAAGATLTGLAPTMPALVVGRAVGGLGLGALAALTYRSVATGFPEALRERVLFAFAAACVVPSLVVPLLAGALVDQAGWRWAVLSPLVLVVWAAARAPSVMGDLPAGDGDLEGPQAARIVLGVALALGASADLSPALRLVLLGAGAAVAGPTLAGLARRAGDPARTGLSLVVAALACAALFGAEPFLLLGLAEVRGQRAAAYGAVLMPASVAWLAGMWVHARLGSRLPRRTVMASGLAVLGAGLAVLGAPVLLPLTSPVAVAAAGRAMAGFGMAMAFTSATLLAIEGSARGAAAVVMLRTVTTAGVAVGAGLAGSLVARAGPGPDGLRSALAAVMVVLLVLVVGALVLTRFMRVQPRSERTGRIHPWWGSYRAFTFVPWTIERRSRPARGGGAPARVPAGGLPNAWPR